MAAEAVGGAVLSAVLQPLFGSLASKDVLEFFRGRNMEKEAEMLEKKWRDVVSLLDDAENKQYEDERVRQWLEELRDAAYDAEDVIDDVATEALRKKYLKAKFLTKFKKGKKIRKIKKIIQKLDELLERKSNLGLNDLVASNIAGSSRSNLFRETSSLVNESRVYGRDGDKEKIIDLLLKEESSSCGNKFSVIPIVGMGGLGKTTLAQIVSKDDRVKDYIKAWACVSDEEVDIKKLTRAILTSVTSRDDQPHDFNLLQNKLKEALTGKKFLIVLDDVWKMISYKDWEDLCRPFEFGAAGSAIIVTTRNGEITSTMRTVDNYDLQNLSDDACWSVFYQHAFVGIRTAEENPDLVGIGKKIVKKCKGLPLAAKSLGGLLRRYKEEESEWEKVLNSKLWDLQKGKDGILPVLKLSYYHLPSHLKRCFAYFSIFPKDYEFEEEMVVLLWMAEGFLQQGGTELEDFGRQCFSELLSMSFFQPSSSWKGRFVMHDLMSDLAQWVAGETCFMLEDSSDGRKISDKARHSFYLRHHYETSSSDKFEVFNRVFYLRTFISRGWWSPKTFISRGWWSPKIVTFDWLSKLKFLRVLSLRGYNIVTELPSWIGDLKHLRYLDLSETNIESLPDSICTLYNLQTLLLIYCTSLKKLPEDMKNLKHLSYLDLSETKIESLPDSICTLFNLQTLLLRDCRSLNKFPEDVKNLISLRHLDISYVNLIDGMPLGVGRLTSLRKLTDFVVGKDSGSGLGELMKLTHLQGTLRISKLENASDAQQTREAALSDKKGLNVLDMKWRDEFDDQRNERVEKEVLDMLRPHKKLKELTIKYYGGVSFPTWVGDSSFSNMVLLELEGCQRCTALPPALGKLPLLKDLRIRKMNGVHSVGAEFYGEGCSNHFPSLETLIFEDMQEWTEWLHVDQQNDSFARLRSLSIVKCPKLLRSLPDHLPSLEKLAIRGSERLTVNFQRLRSLKMDYFKSMTLSSVTFLIDGLIGRHLEIEDGRHLVIKQYPQLLSLVAKEEEEEQQPKLESLYIEDCENLENLKGLYNLTSLRNLTIISCPRLVSLLESGLPAMLRELTIEHCTALTSITSFEYLQDEEEDDASSPSSSSPNSMMMNDSNNSHRRSLLEYLTIWNCPSLTSLSSSRGWELPTTLKSLFIWGCPKLESIGEMVQHDYTSLDRFRIFNCKNFKTLHNLRELCIYNCDNLVSLTGEGLPATLEELEILGCSKLESIGEVLHNNTSLDSIEIGGCKSLESLPENLCNLTRLSSFCISNCPSLIRFPGKGLPAANLRTLWISICEKLEALPPMHDLIRLEELHICECERIVSFPEGGFPTNITELNIKHLKIHQPLSEWGLHRLTSLEQLRIRDVCPDLVSFPADEGIKNVLPSSIIYLTIEDFPNLKSLSSDGFQNLSSLEELCIVNCPKLQSFPKEGLFPSLLVLNFYKCPLLTPRCERDLGHEWPKISHVPDISHQPNNEFESKQWTRISERTVASLQAI